MPIKIPTGIPSGRVLQNEQIFVMSTERAYHQDIRPLQILLVNLMPNKQDTEAQFFRLLGNSALQVEANLLYTASYQPKHTSRRYLGRFYKTFEDIEEMYFDGMIVTGAPVELMAFEEVDYWRELCRIMDWSSSHVFSSLYICWGAQAGLYHFYGVPKHRLSEKCFGVFPHRLLCDPNMELFRGFDDEFFVPHSRHTEVRMEDLEKCPEVEVLAASDEAGVMASWDPENRRFFITGHVEYDPQTLKNEYFRDVKKGLDIHVPINYFPDDDPTREPIVRWRSSANLLFSNWLNYFVYQQTPYDLEGIGRRNY